MTERKELINKLNSIYQTQQIAIENGETPILNLNFNKEKEDLTNRLNYLMKETEKNYGVFI